MRPSYCIFFLFFLLIGCQNEDKLTFEPHAIEGEVCANCPKINIKLPLALNENKLARTVNSALREEVISLLHFDDEQDVTDIETAIKSFESGFVALQEKYEDETTPWEAKIDSKVTFEDESVLTISLDAFIFTGGAHGYTAKRFLNFDKKKGLEVENEQLFKNKEDFKAFAEKMFRQQEKIPTGETINYTGFMFEENSFYLPENMGFTEKGLILLYNQYEVSSFADGTIELILPHADVKKYLTEQ